jgi:hypothetical protein
MTMPKVGIVHRRWAAASLPEIYKSSMGICEPIIFLHESAAVDADITAFAQGLFRTELVSESTLAGTCRRAGVQGLTTFCDLDLELVDQVSNQLRLPSAGAVFNAWDKLVQRQRIPAEFSVAYLAVDSAEAFRKALEEIGRPAVLKPRRATGGDGVALIHSPEDAEFQLAFRSKWDGCLLEAMMPSGGHPSGVDYLGDYLSVETVNTGDARYHVAVCDKTPVEIKCGLGRDGADAVSTTGDVYPSRLSDAFMGPVIAAVDAALSSLDVRWRVTHTEVKLTERGAAIIEVNGRVGGHLSKLLKMIGGPDLIRSALQLSLGQRPETEHAPRGYAMGYYPPFPDPRGEVRSHVTALEVRELPAVKSVTELSQQAQPRSATQNRMVNLLLHAPDLTSLDLAAQQVDEGIRALFSQDLQDGEQQDRAASVGHRDHASVPGGDASSTSRGPRSTH